MIARNLLTGRKRLPTANILPLPRRWYTPSNSNNNTTTTTAAASKTVNLRGWRKYTEQFKNKPASYITTFALLHELTAIVPFPLVYYGLSWSSIQVPVPEQAIAEGNRIVNKVRTRYGYEPLDADNRAMINLATTYAIVKVMLPLRIGASLAMTPYLAEKWVGPLMSSMATLLKKFKLSP